MNTDQIPNIGSGKASSAPLGNFLRKEQIVVAPEIMSDMRIQIPPLFYWETVDNGVSVLMTAAFQYHGKNYGESFPMDTDNAVMINIMRKKLIRKVTETMDVLVNHGEQILDGFGNIDPQLVMDQEAIRWKYDRNWSKKVAAFNKLVRVAPITRSKAVKLGLLPKPKV